MEDSKRYDFNSTDLLFKVYVYRKPLLIITISAAIISAIISLFITDKYKASVVLFPAPSMSISKAYLDPRSYSSKGAIFGEDEEVEQILQVLNSEEIKQRIITKYNLIKHYDIDPGSKSIQTKITEAFKGNIKFARTDYMAVEISVMDISPDTAALIANDISLLIDSSMCRMQKERAFEAFQIVEKEYLEKKAQLQQLEDSLSFIMKQGVFDFESQSEVFNNAYATAIIEGKTNAANEFKKQLNSLAQYGSAYVAIRNLLEFEQEQFTLLTQKYKEAKVDAESELTHTYIVDKAYAPDKKSYPKRSIIVVISTITSFVIGFILMILFELYKDFKSRNLKPKE